jgi:cytochrome c oxidase subunit 2
MRVDLYERIWMWGAAALILVFVGALIFAAAASAIHPPSHVETIDPTTAAESGEFAEPGVIATPGGARVVMRAQMYSFMPGEVRVPRGRPVTFRVTSTDVLHGFQIVGTNANMMISPGYVSQFTMTFPRSGEYLILCNEYCGLGHHLMQAKLIVEDAG